MKKKNTSKIKRSIGVQAFQIFAYLLVAFLALICLYPFWFVLMASFSTASEVYKHVGLLLKPLAFTLEAYEVVLEQELLLSGYANTLFYLCVNIPLNVTMTALGAYFFSRKNVYFQNILFKYCLLTMYISGGMIAFYLNLRDLGLLGSRWGVILSSCLSCYNMIILRTAFASIPDSLCDAARIDGAGHIATLFKVVMPLAKASIAVIALYYGVGIWNSWFWNQIITRDAKMWPLQAVLRKLLIEDADLAVDGGAELAFLETARYAVIVVSVVPVVMVYPWIQKYFHKGALIGAVKG